MDRQTGRTVYKGEGAGSILMVHARTQFECEPRRFLTKKKTQNEKIPKHLGEVERGERRVERRERERR